VGDSNVSVAEKTWINERERETEILDGIVGVEILNGVIRILYETLLRELY
jgi:hypothetical protein